MQLDLKQYLTKRNIIIGGVVTVAIIAAVGSFYLPGFLFQGSLPSGMTLRCRAEPSTALKGAQVKLIAELGELTYSEATGSSYYIAWTGDVGPNGTPVLENATTETEIFTSTVTGSSITVTYPQDYAKDTANIQVGLTDGNNFEFAKCSVNLLDEPIVIPQPKQDPATVLPTYTPSTSQVTIPNPLDPASQPSKSGSTGTSSASTSKGFGSALPSSANNYSVSCQANMTTAKVGDTVRWSATLDPATKGVDYTWNGDDIKTNDFAQGKIFFDKVYSTAGVKKASVKLESASTSVDFGTGKSLYASCGQVVVTSNPLDVDCSVTPNPAKVGQPVVWSATVTGGVAPYKYEWTDNLDYISGKNLPTVSAVFLEEKVDSAKIDITDSAGNTATTKCPILTVSDSTAAPLDPGAFVDTKAQTQPDYQIVKPSVSCSTSPSTAYPGDSVVWSAMVQNIDESEVTAYTWDGDVSGSARDLSAKYSSDGIKSANVTITYSGGTATSDECNLTINPEISTDPEPNSSESTDTSIKTDTSIDESTKKTQALELVMSQCPGVYYPKDIQGHWAENLIKDAYDQCWVRGYADNTFRPNSAITRAEATKIVMVGANVQPNLGCYDADCGSPFVDLDMWQGPWIRPAYDAGIVEGYSDVSFAPNRLITRAESSALVTRAFGLQPFVGCYTANCGAGHPDNLFVDIYDFWQGPYIRTLWDAGIVQGTSSNTFEPNRPISRAELLKMSYSAAGL